MTIKKFIICTMISLSIIITDNDNQSIISMIKCKLTQKQMLSLLVKN